MLTFKGYEVIESGTGEEGVRLAQERRPSLVLMDIRLPGIDGVEALRRLRAEETTRGIPDSAPGRPGDCGGHCGAGVAPRAGLAPWVGSTRDGWSVWLRETVGGAPRTWARLVETLVHELAHCTVPEGTGHTAPLRAAQRRLEQTARAGALDPAEPGDVADLFVVTADRQERSRALFQ